MKIPNHREIIYKEAVKFLLDKNDLKDIKIRKAQLSKKYNSATIGSLR